MLELVKAVINCFHLSILVGSNSRIGYICHETAIMYSTKCVIFKLELFWVKGNNLKQVEEHFSHFYQKFLMIQETSMPRCKSSIKHLREY